MAAPTRCWSRAKRNCDTSVSDMQAERRQHGSSEATFGCLVSTVHLLTMSGPAHRETSEI